MRSYYFWTLLFTPLLLIAESDITEAFMQGAIHGQIKLFSYTIDNETDEDDYTTALGGYLKYNTDTKRPFFGILRFHTAQPVGYQKNKEDTAVYDENGDALTVNSEAYIGWSHNKKILKVGNFMLNTPMMNDDTTRIVPWSYQGFAFTGEALPYTKVQFNYIRQTRSYTSDEYKRESASGQIGSGITMLGLQYDGIEGWDLQSYYYYAPDLYSTLTLQTNYSYIIDDHHLICIGMQYFNSGNGGKYAERENKNGGDDINLLALKILFHAEDWSMSLNYSQNFGISGIVKGYGGLSKVFTTSMIANGRGNYKPETWMLETHYDLPFTKWGQSEMAFTYTNTRTKDSRGDDFDAYYAHWRQRFSIDSSLFVRYEHLDYKGGKSDSNYLRIIASYNF